MVYLRILLYFYGSKTAIKLSKGRMESENITLRLTNERIWRKFSEIGTEMIVTKSGRKLFPKLEYEVKGMDPKGLYRVILQLERADDMKYKHDAGHWNPSVGETRVMPKQILGGEGDGIAVGSEWMKRPVTFDRFKVTNNSQVAERDADKVYIQSMHKYLPVVYIFRYDYEQQWTAAKQVLKHETETAQFIAVTCYQNPKITALKIELNPFAKGFRDNEGRKRSSTSPSSDGEPQSSIRRTTPQAGLYADIKDFSPTLNMDEKLLEGWHNANNFYNCGIPHGSMPPAMHLPSTSGNMSMSPMSMPTVPQNSPMNASQMSYQFPSWYTPYYPPYWHHMSMANFWNGNNEVTVEGTQQQSHMIL